jgi:hypothetical protein
MSEVKVNKISPRSGTDVTLGDSGDNFIIPSGATLTNNGSASGFASIAWQSAIKTASFTAVAGEGYWVNTTSGAITITLPASASVGDQIIFTDYARTWGTNAVTVNQNSLNFQGQTSPNPEYNTSGQSVNIVYSGATQGWIPNSDDDVTDEVPQTTTISYLVIAGGGGGGGGLSGNWGAGGGAGGYRNSYASETSGRNSSTETPLSLNSGTVLTVTIGTGGGAGGAASNGTAGNDSSITGTGVSITSTGGGYGAGAGPSSGDNGGNGGSGGGAADGNLASATGGSGTANQGFDGGDAEAQGSGGGGGAGAAGTDSLPGASRPVAGGAGLSSSITGSAVTRGVGGDGSKNPAATKTDGTGDGGDGSDYPASASDGADGIVILRMPTANYSGTTTGSPTVDTDGTDTILSYTGSGSYTV